MHRLNFLRFFFLLIASNLIVACEPIDLGELKKAPASFLADGKKFLAEKKSVSRVTSAQRPRALGEILDGSLANKNQGSDFVSAIKYALDTDPNIISKRREIEAKLAAVEVSKAKKDFQVGTTLYGGIEDITDNTKGVAVALNASRVIFDGGKLNSEIDSANLTAEAVKMEVRSFVDRRAYELCEIWLELEKYEALQSQIDRRLAVLDPLIDQLEQVAEAGIGDVSKVTAAQRTVSAIRVEQTNISEGLAQAHLEFVNAFGELKKEIAFDYDRISKLVPAKIDDEMIQKSPLLLSQYAAYQASIARLEVLRAKDGFDVGFEARALRPFAGSGKDSDESIGLVGRKTLFSGGMLESEIVEAEAQIKVLSSLIQATYRNGANAVETAKQNIKSMDKAILIARENAKLTSDEIVYLRQQLIIGGSTLDSVLSAEARLYEAESKEVNFSIEKHKSELMIASSLGLLGKSLGF